MTEEPTPWIGDPCPTCGGYIGIHHGHRPAYRPPTSGESSRDATTRRWANRVDRDARDRYTDARCDVCGQVRHHVSHEMDPDNSPEGPEYHADFTHHPFAQRPKGEPG